MTEGQFEACRAALALSDIPGWTRITAGHSRGQPDRLAGRQARGGLRIAPVFSAHPRSIEWFYGQSAAKAY